MANRTKAEEFCNSHAVSQLRRGEQCDEITRGAAMTKELY